MRNSGPGLGQSEKHGEAKPAQIRFHPRNWSTKRGYRILCT